MDQLDPVSRNDQHDAALLIDWENLKYSLATEGRTVSISSLRDAAEKYGRLVVARAYADWQDYAHSGDAPNLYISGIEPIYVPCRQYYNDADQSSRRKNSVDVKLTADCIELCHRYPTIQTYVLVSGDQDFLHVVNTLRPYGKRTVAIGVSWSTSPRLAEQVDAMIYYDRDVDPIEAPPPPPVKVSDSTPKTLTLIARELANELHIPGDTAGATLEGILTKILSITREYRQRDQTLLLSQLGLELQKQTTAGEFALFVRGRLSPIIAKLAGRNLVQRVERGMVTWLFLPDETVPDELGVSETHAAGSYGGPTYVHTPSSGFRRVRRLYRELSDGEQADVIRFINRLSESMEYIGFSRLANDLERDGPISGDEVDFRSVITDMLETEHILLLGNPRTWFDPASGKTGEFNTLVLNRDHGDVQTALADP